MSRPVRIEFPGANYHVTSKGKDETDVFLDNEDRKIFLNTLEGVAERYNWIVHAYVLMDAHYHLVVEVPRANLSKGMRQLNGVYTQHFNRKHACDGPLFQGRFKSVLFEPETCLPSLCRHVALNPVRLGEVSNPERYRWSHHRATTGLINPPPFLAIDDLLGHFGRRRKDNQRKYRDYVRQGSAEPSPLNDRISQVLLGSDEFVARMQPLLEGTGAAKRGPARAGRKRSLDSIFRNVDGKSRPERNDLIRKAHLDQNYTLMEIGDHLGLHYTTVSKVINS